MKSAITDQKSPIRDLGYKPYDGPRLSHRGRFQVLFRRNLALAWASTLVKVDLILSMFPMVVCAVIMYLKLAAQKRGLPIKEDPGLWVFNCIFWCQIWFAFTMSLLVAAPTISADVRSGAFQFYFARPVSRMAYLLGKVLSAAVLIASILAIPGLLLAIMRVALAADGGDALTQLPLLLKTILYSVLFTATLILPAFALGALSRQPGYVQGGWAALFFLPWLLGEGIAAATEIPYIALISLPTNLRWIGEALFGVPSSHDLAWYWPTGALLLIVGCATWWVIRRLDRVEVFS
jgi:ABC-2 type transport system permease protein